MRTRVAFVGKRSSFEDCALSEPAGGLVPRFFDAGLGDAGEPRELREAVEAWGPQVVVVLRPQHFEAGAFSGLRAVTVGVVDEAVSRRPGGDPREHALPAEVANGLDRIVTCDPLAAQAAAPVWRSFALPVDDRIYAAVRPPEVPARALFVGESTAHRERFLINSKHEFDVLHYAHGLYGEKLREVFRRCDVAINLHRGPYPSFDSRFLAHLAAGHLLLSEPLSPTHGLEAGIDFVEVRRPDELTTVLAQLSRRPETYERVRLRGRAKAEEHRASRVWPRLVADLLRDLKTFGSQRAA